MFSENFHNFQGCELVLMMPVLRSTKVSNIWGHSIVIDGSSSFEVHGIIPKIFEIASKVYNFKEKYQPVNLLYESSFISNPTADNFEIININGTYREPSVCIEFIAKSVISQLILIRHTIPFLELSRIFLVTPGKPYKSYEKLLLPFDFIIWILLMATIFVVLIVIIECEKI